MSALTKKNILIFSEGYKLNVYDRKEVHMYSKEKVEKVLKALMSL
jgi:hypothetical protein